MRGVDETQAVWADRLGNLLYAGNLVCWPHRRGKTVEMRDGVFVRGEFQTRVVQKLKPRETSGQVLKSVLVFICEYEDPAAGTTREVAPKSGNVTKLV